MINKLKALSAIALISFSALAQDASEVLDVVSEIKKQEASESKSYQQEIREGLEKKGAIIGIREIPVTKLYFVEAELGSYLVTANGRFVVDGRIVDVWHRKTLKSLADLEGIDRVPVNNNAKQIDDMLATFSIGDKEKPRSGVIFVDPTSEYTLTSLQKLIEYQDEQRWTVVLTPLIGGSNAVDRSRRLWCAKDKEQALLDLINGTQESFSEIDEDCDEERVLAGQYINNVFGIETLPHLIREDGLVSKGFPIDFDKWFEKE